MAKDTTGKTRTLYDLAKIVNKLKKEGGKIVHCHGVFDLIHPGHIRYLKSAKKYGDVLVVTITADEFVRKGPGRPIFKENLRAEFLASIEYVDYVAINHSYSAVPAIKLLKPDFYIKGPDYKNRKTYKDLPSKLNEEEKEVVKGGGKIVFTDDIVFSSSQLINDYLEDHPKDVADFLENFKRKYTSDFIIEKILSLKDIKILVIGDAIIDQYHYCLPIGKSSKEPIIVHKYTSDESFLGGTLATANHVATLSRSVELVTVLGKKQSFELFIRKHLKKNITPAFFYRRDINTTIKKRFVDVATKQKLFQISYLKDDLIQQEIETKIISFLKSEIGRYDLVIANDFGHGLMTDKIIKFLCAKSKFLALNVQANSANYGFNVVTKYPRADFVCIDEQELRLASHDKYSPLPTLIQKIFKKMKCKEMIITRGADGTISYSGENKYTAVPAFTQKFVDRVGAGDALFAISAPCVYKNFPCELSAFLGNAAGTLKVQVIGNKKSIEIVELTKFITRLLK